MGLPEMDAFWSDLSTRKEQNNLDKDEERFFKKLVKALVFLSQNPRHPGLASHEIDDLTHKHGIKISNPIWKTIHPRRAGYSGRMAQTKET